MTGGSYEIWGASGVASHFADACHRRRPDRSGPSQNDKMASAVVAIAGKAIKGEEGDGEEY